MSKFHLNKVIREANKAKRAMVNQIKHDLVYGKCFMKAEIESKLKFLENVNEPFDRKYWWIEDQRVQGLKIA